MAASIFNTFNTNNTNHTDLLLNDYTIKGIAPAIMTYRGTEVWYLWLQYTQDLEVTYRTATIKLVSGAFNPNYPVKVTTKGVSYTVNDSDLTLEVGWPPELLRETETEMEEEEGTIEI